MSSRSQSRPPESKGSQKSRSSGIAHLATHLESTASTRSQHPLWRAMGGLLGIVETILPGVLFIVVFTITRNPWLAIYVSVGISVLFTGYRLVRRQNATQAIAGLCGAVASALIAVLTQRPENNFLVGLWTNAAYGIVLLLSVVLRWPLVGVVVSLFRSENKTQWRKNKHSLRVYSWVTMLWVGMFALRLAVEVPLYFAGNIDGLAIAKLALGLPIYVPVLAATWLIIRSLYHEQDKAELS